MEHRPRLCATVAFLAGILVCLGFKDLYPDLERRYRRRYGARRTLAGAGLEEKGQIGLEDRERGDKGDAGIGVVPEGIEACIGNTPLFRIKSLSDVTGCEILGKAEVTLEYRDNYFGLIQWSVVPQRWRWQPQRQGCSQYDKFGTYQCYIAKIHHAEYVRRPRRKDF